MKPLKLLHKVQNTLTSQLSLLSVLGIVAALLLGLVSSLCLNMHTSETMQNQHMQEMAAVLAQTDTVKRLLMTGQNQDKELVQAVAAQMEGVDVVLVADPQGQVVVFGGRWSGDYVTLPRSGESLAPQRMKTEHGLERCAFAPVYQNQQLLGYVMTGVHERFVYAVVGLTLAQYLLIGVVAVLIGAVLARRMAVQIKGELKGYEPNVFAQMVDQRTEVWDALEEGVLAIDAASRIVYVNAAAVEMLHLDAQQPLGAKLHQVYPASTLERILQTGQPEYNVPLRSLQDAKVLADRVPVRKEGKIIGAVAIFRNRTEMMRLAQDLTGVRHVMEALRANNHEFMNKLHVILGLLQLEEYQEAERYVLELTKARAQSTGDITKRIQEPSVAALLIGKLSRAQELQVHFSLDPSSNLLQGSRCLSTHAMILILGNLIENAFDSFRHVASGAVREVEVCILEEEKGLLICVEDSGCGMEPDVCQRMFQQGYSTKGEGRGTGLALVQQMLESYGGTIRVESTPGLGTTITINVPVQQEEKDL